MSLSAAVNMIADAMQETAKVFGDHPSHDVIMNFANQLRVAIKASEGSGNPPQILVEEMEDQLLKIKEREQKAKEREVRRLAEREEATTEQMREAADGPFEGSFVLTSSAMPVGARMFLGDKYIYVLEEDNRLHYDKETNEKRGIVSP